MSESRAAPSARAVPGPADEGRPRAEARALAQPVAFSADRLIGAVRRVIGPNDGLVGLHEPEFGGREREYLIECIDSTFVSSVGLFVDRFEAMLAEITGARRAVAVVNGTAALHVCLMLAGVVAGDEVIMPALTFVATANAASFCGAVPHFVDVDVDTLGMSPVALAARLDAVGQRRGDHVVNRETGRRLAAIVPMHCFGHPADIAGLRAVAQGWGIPFVEDAAEALGSVSGDRMVGADARLAALSFNGNKIVTTGGGGAVLTDDPDLGRRAKHLTTTAKQPHRWAFVHDAIGYNYRLPNLNAALGCAQLEQLSGFVARKRALAAAYETALADIDGVTLCREPVGTRSNYWLIAVLLDRRHAPCRDELLAALNDSGIGARPVWTLMHRLPMYASCPRDELHVSEDIEARLINLPSSARLGGETAR